MHPAAPFNGTVPPASSRHGAEYTLHGAAERLGCSLNTLRRRIKAGEIQAERVSRPQGHTWRVFLPLNGDVTVQHRAERSTVQSAPFSGTVQSRDETDVAPLVDLVRDLTDRLHQQDIEHAATLVRHAEAAAMWQARAELLAGELAAAREQVRALQAPRPETEHVFSTDAAESLPTEQASPVAPPADPAPRRWWQRLLFG